MSEKELVVVRDVNGREHKFTAGSLKNKVIIEMIIKSAKFLTNYERSIISDLIK